MQTVVLVDAAPGFEDAVEAAMRREAGVTNVVRMKEGNYDLAVLLDTQDAAVLQRLMTSRIPHISGVRGLMRVDNPAPALVAKLTTSA